MHCSAVAVAFGLQTWRGLKFISHTLAGASSLCVCVYESVRLCVSVLKCADLCITLYECVQYVSGCSPAGMRACMHTHLHESSRA